MEYLIYHRDVPHKIFLIKELTSQQMKCENRPMLMEITGLVMFHPHLKEAKLIEQQGSLLKIQLQCQLGGNTWQSWGKVLQEAIYGLNQHPMYGGFPPPPAHSTESRGKKAVSSLTTTSSHPLAEFLSHPSDLILCWSRGLSSKMGNASTRKDKNDPIELELNTAVWPFRAPHVSESMGKEGSYCAGWVLSPDFLLPRENWTATPQWK